MGGRKGGEEREEGREREVRGRRKGGREEVNWSANNTLGW